MVPVGALRVIHYGGTRQKALRGLIRPVAWLLLVLPAHHVAVLNSPEQRQNPHHQVCARSNPPMEFTHAHEASSWPFPLCRICAITLSLSKYSWRSVSEDGIDATFLIVLNHRIDVWSSVVLRQPFHIVVAEREGSRITSPCLHQSHHSILAVDATLVERFDRG